MDHFIEIQAGDEPEGASSMRTPSRITSFKRPSIKEKQKQKKKPPGLRIYSQTPGVESEHRAQA